MTSTMIEKKFFLNISIEQAVEMTKMAIINQGAHGV